MQHQQKNKFSNQLIIKTDSQQNPSYVLTYIEATQEGLECKIENQKPQPFSSLTKGDRKSLQNLSERDDIVITKADKGGVVVIIDAKDYIREAESQLKKEVKYDPTETHSRLTNDTIKRFKKQKMMEQKVAK